MVGEIRDKETADIAVQAALTGHLVLSTVHTNDAVGAITRMRDMKVEPFLLASTVRAVIAQRLVRKLCEHCREPIQADGSLASLLGFDRGTVVFQATGCEHCNHTGYQGRIGVFELLVMNEMVKDAILNRKTSYEIRRISVETSGLVTLLEDGLLKAAQGQTSLQEVLRHLPKVSAPRPLREIARLSGVNL